MREYWIKKLLQLADPVLDTFVTRTKKMSEAGNEQRLSVMYLEAIGRLLCGMAPWLERKQLSSSEEALRQKYAALSREAIDAATDPDSPVACNFSDAVGAQPLVDAAFLGQAILRAPNELWEKLEDRVKENVIACFKKSAQIRSYRSNWLLFSAMIQTALARMGEKPDMMHVDYALFAFEKWYKGDGAYGDGESFAFDFYNSYVIHPMLVDITARVGAYYGDRREQMEQFRQQVVQRAARYAAVQESMISPDGSYPPLGRSITYRCGAFHCLAQAALLHNLTPLCKPAQVRGALEAAIRRTLEAENTFDENGWLKIGLCGFQTSLAETYISTGSLYLCSTAFLPLGLPENDPFWNDPDIPWTMCKVWNGVDEKIK